MRLCRPILQEDRTPEAGKILLLNHPVQKMRQAAPECREEAELSQEAARELEIHQEMVQEAAREHRRVPEEAAGQFPVEAPEHRRRPEAVKQLREAARELRPHQGRCLNENSRTGTGRL